MRMSGFGLTESVVGAVSLPNQARRPTYVSEQISRRDRVSVTSVPLVRTTVRRGAVPNGLIESVAGGGVSNFKTKHGNNKQKGTTMIGSHQRVRTSSLLILAFNSVALIYGGLGCSDPGRATSDVSAATGTLRLALTSELDGVRYRLDATFAINGPQSTILQSAADEAVLSTSLSVGTYTVALREGFQVLEELPNGSWQPVRADLLSGAERLVTIEPNATAQVTYRFGIRDELLEFGAGELQINFTVEREPETLASGQSGPQNVAVDSRNVYWANHDGDAVMKVALSGGDPVALAAYPHACTVAIDASNVYFATCEGGLVGKVPIDGGEALLLATGQAWPGKLAVDATHVYWTNLDGTIMKAPIDGGDLVQLASAQDQPDAVVVDADSVYWTTVDAILKVSIHGGDPTPLAVEQSPVGTFAVADGSVFWSNGPAGTIARVSVDGGPVAVLATSDGFAQGATVDSSFVYWATNLGSVMKTALAGGITTELARGENNPGNPALGGGFLYWPEIVAFNARIRRVGL
jgi:hypothetical protein